MTDSHCHLMMEPLSSDLPFHLKRFVQNGGKHLLNAAFDIESIYQVIEIYNKYHTTFPGLLKNAFGIHPETFVEDLDFNGSMASFEKARKIVTNFEQQVAQNRKIVHAIGETGLDYHQLFDSGNWSTNDIQESMEIQKYSFGRHLELALELGLPLTIHSREAKEHTNCITDTLSMISDIGRGNIKGVIHSYTGDINFVPSIIGLGLYIGFNPIITYKSGESVREIVKVTPIENIVLETDSTLLPLRIKGATKFGTPSDVGEVAKLIAQLKDISYERVIEVTSQNFQNLFLRS